jgi:peptidoglycan-associated lipoprotein
MYTAPIALAMAIASTGCRHHHPPVTPLPQPGTTGNNQSVNNTLPAQPPYGGQFAESSDFKIGDWNQDRAALAADTIHFAYDSSVIRESETANLQAVAAALSSDKAANLMIEGNCDERGTEEYNRSLGERRAEAAREALAGMGVDASRVHTVSYGKDKPADQGHDEAAWSHNRCDEFVVLHPKTGS